MDEREFRIKGNIQSFDVHEVKYEDARYFLQPVPDVRIEKHKKKYNGRKEAHWKFIKTPVIMHLGSESESSSLVDSDKDNKEETS